MNELIKITESNGKRAVSARELHAFLESKQEFANWIKSRISQYGLVENEDFVTIDKVIKRKEGVRGASKATEYALTIDCAKELSMVEGNEKGKQARRYFIRAEKALREIEKKTLADFESRINKLESRNNSPEPDCMTVYGFANTKRIRLYGSEAVSLGKRAVKLCKERSEEIGRVKDVRFGWVNVYPEYVLEGVFDEFFKNPRF